MTDVLMIIMVVVILIAAVEVVWLGSIIRQTGAALKSTKILEESAEDDLRRIDQLYVEMRKKWESQAPG